MEVGSEAVGAAAGNTAAHDDRSARILVVDDDPTLCLLATSKLAEDGHAAEQARDGEAGWRRLNSEVFDMALIDLEMPGVDGFTLIEWIRGDPRLRFLPVIVVTSRNDNQAIDRAFGVGANSFVTKPVNWPLFLHQVRYVWRASQAEQELRRAKERAVTGSKLKDNFMSVMSHELRTPLNHIIGFAEVLERQADGPIGNEAYLSYISEIAQGGRRLLGTVTDMFLFSKSLSGDLDFNEGEYELSSIMGEACAAIEPVAQSHGVKLFLSAIPMDQRVICDLQLFNRCLTGVLDNAVKFSPQGATVRLDAAILTDGALQVSVNDQGPGMSPEQIAHCHEPFVQSDMSIRRSVEGIGLGLSIARTLMDMHNGSLKLESVPGSGTTARLTLPAERLIAPAPALADELIAAR